MDPNVARLERIEAEISDLRRMQRAARIPARSDGSMQVRLAVVLAENTTAWPRAGASDDVARFPIRFVDPDFDNGDFNERSDSDTIFAADAHGWQFTPSWPGGFNYQARFIPPGAIVHVAWANGYWWIVAAPEIYSAKVQAGYTNFDAGSGYAPATKASVKLVSVNGAAEIGDAFYVWLDVPAGFDPYLFAGDIIRICCPANHGHVTELLPFTVTPVHHVKRLNPILWYWGSVPRGFQLADGTNGTTDFRGYFLRMKASGESVGATGGYDKHGVTENNHEDHADHDDHPDPAHNEAKTDDEYDTAPSVGGSLLMSDVSVTHEGQDWSHSAHGAHTDSDNRPKFRNVDVIQRVS